MYQVWFSVNVEPTIPTDYLEDRGYLAPNWFYQIGNSVSGRMLCRCMTEHFETIRSELDSFNKETIVAGARYQLGEWLEDYPCNQAEFDKFMQDRIEDDVIIPAVDNTSAGWVAFND